MAQAKVAKMQREIAGFERPTTPELEELAAPYCEALDTQLDAQKRANQLRQQLLDRMDALGVSAYEYVDGEYSHKLQRRSTTKLSRKRTRVVAEEAAAPAEAGQDAE